MKVGVFLNRNVPPTDGGGFSYLDKLTTAIDNYTFDSALEICFVGRTPPSRTRFRKEYHQLSSRWLVRFDRTLTILNFVQFLARVTGRAWNFSARRDRSLLRKYGIDILFFPQPLAASVENFPKILTSWDVGHRTLPSFPELRTAFSRRERWYRTEMPGASAICVESETGKRELMALYGVEEAKIAVIPLFPGGVADMTVSDARQRDLLAQIRLEPGSYFFYPAQYWAHKNHATLVVAFQTLLSRHPQRKLKLVFTGADKGTKRSIQAFVEQAGLEEHVMLFGFVGMDLVHTLYTHAIALTMPTFLGPTNMPPLEAHQLRTAVICSDLPGHRETCGEGAVYAKATEPLVWADAMEAVLDESYRAALIRAADRVALSSWFTADNAMRQLEQALLKLVPELETKR